ncbi:MAG: radical SAM protein [Clostridium sp.]|nr:radical SAM protein [Clostridium sp.]
MSVVKCNVPLNIQYEVTYRCNNRCIFCYNEKDDNYYEEINTQGAIQIVRDVASCGVMSMNFNGGEPLIRSDFFDIVKVAYDSGLDIHMNTNSSLIDEFNAKMIAKYFPSICTTVLDSDSGNHDILSGRKGAFNEAMQGIRNLQRQDVYVAVNIMLSKRNIDNIEETYNLLRTMRIRSVLITRYVPCEMNTDGLDISDQQFLQAVAKVYMFNKKYSCFDRIAFPQPYKLCNSTRELHKNIQDSNIACNIGLCTISIGPNGDITPCNLVKYPILGNLKKESLKTIWDRFDGVNHFCNVHLDEKCIKCADLQYCGGGCKGYNDAVEKGK